jgi:hypothetical protein
MEYVWITLTYLFCTLITFLRKRNPNLIVTSSNVIKGYFVVLIIGLLMFYFLQSYGFDLNYSIFENNPLVPRGIKVTTIFIVVISFMYWASIKKKRESIFVAVKKSTTLKRYSNEIQKLIANGETEKLIKFLREDIAVNLKLNEEEKEAILLISSNFEKLRRDFHKGLLGQKEYQIELNRLSNSILNLLT